MPGMNGTGPQGMGSMTGRGMGKCNPNNENVSNVGYGLGRGLGRGRGRGLGRGYNSYNYSMQDEKTMLESRLNEINKMIDKEEK